MISTERGAEKGFVHIYSSLRISPIFLFEESEPDLPLAAPSLTLALHLSLAGLIPRNWTPSMNQRNHYCLAYVWTKTTFNLDSIPSLLAFELKLWTGLALRTLLLWPDWLARLPSLATYDRRQGSGSHSHWLEWDQDSLQLAPIAALNGRRLIEKAAQPAHPFFLP